MVDALSPQVCQARALVADALKLLEDSQGPSIEKLRAAAEPLLAGRWTVLVSGLRSVGKSSFVGALWGDAQMLPTAEHDCTQTNTLIRVPQAGEAEARILLSYLPRPAAEDYATRDLAFYRLLQLLLDIEGPLAAMLEEKLPAERLHAVVNAVRKLFAERRDISVLHEPLTEELEKLEQFLAFLDAPEFRPGQTVPARWEDRQEHLMGHRRPDGRTLDVGKLLALRHVEMVRSTDRFPHLEALGPPQVIDTPWIPTFHNARRADLVLAQGRRADILVIIALPGRFEPEPWVVEMLRERPELLKRTLLVFNQVDTIDTVTLFSHDGFAASFTENAERLRRLGLARENLFVSCARLPFLECSPPTARLQDLAARLRQFLERLTKLTAGRPDSDFKQKLLRACDPADAGMESVRARLLELARGPVMQAQAQKALQALAGVSGLDVPVAQHAAWKKIVSRCAELRRI